MRKSLIGQLPFGLLLMSSVAFGNIYGTYQPETVQNKPETKNIFMDGEFEKIKRFDPLVFDNATELKDSSEYYFSDVVLQELNATLQEGLVVHVTIVGNTDRPTDDASEQRVASQTYGAKVERWFRYSLDTNTSKALTKSYVDTLHQRFLDEGFDDSLFVLEYRNGKDMAYTQATKEGNELSNVVMVSMYVEYKEDLDSDEDGVQDSMDMCGGTPKNVSVDQHGCPKDNDGDGVLDYADVCKETPKDVEVDKQGCAIDSDSDGVADYKDKCQGTAKGFEVDPKGCPVQKSLALNFQTNSAKIYKSSFSKVVEFAEFLKENPKYSVEIVGHTDSIGKAEANMKLSIDRAKAVQDALVDLGIDPKRLSFRGRGEFEPLVSNRTKEGRKKNRRIEVLLKK